MRLKSIIAVCILIVSAAGMMLFSGCAFTQPSSFKNVGGIQEIYNQQIKDWQRRVKDEGWTDSIIKDISKTIINYSLYTSDRDAAGNLTDHWNTPQEMIDAGFKGDCEDIAITIWGTFKRLKYPYDVRITVVYVPQAFFVSDPYHAVVHVEYPDGRWRMVETVSILGPLHLLDEALYIPVMQFDDKRIWR